MKPFQFLRRQNTNFRSRDTIRNTPHRVHVPLLAVMILWGTACEAQSRNAPEASSSRTTPPPATTIKAAPNVYAHEVKDIDGKQVSLERYRGKVVLLVNTASECGYTSQYGDLETLYRTYRDRGFEILAFPSNDFGGQEPNDEAFIKSFTAENFGVSFPLFAKVQTRGLLKSPLYRTLTEAGPEQFRGEVAWNFTKFLVGPEGQILARFGSSTSPTGPELRSAIEQALASRKLDAAKPDAKP